MEKAYAQALYTLSQHADMDADALVTRLMHHLNATGRTKLLPRIQTELTRLKAHHAHDAMRIELAREEDRTEALEAARALGIDATPVINDQLITGWRATGKGGLVDHSGKRALLDLYRAITT